MYALLLALLACWLTLPVLAQQPLARARQSSYLTKVFRLTETQTRRLYERGMGAAEPAFFTQAVDSFPTDPADRRAAGARRMLPPGYYLLTHAEGPQLVYELRAETARTLEVIDNQVDLVLVVRDSLGRLLPAARVAMAGQAVPFDAATGTFRRARGARAGLTAVTEGGRTTFHPLSQTFPGGQWRGRSWAGRTGLRVLYAPLTYLVRPVRRLAYQLRRFDSQTTGPVGLLRSAFSEDVRDERQQQRAQQLGGHPRWTGYLALSRPRYRPGGRDTLRLKARVLRGVSGRPSTRPLTLWLRGGAADKRLATLRPTRPGTYEFSLPLGDTLGLRPNSFPVVYLADKKNTQLVSGSFQFEDYELNNVRYALRPLASAPRRGQVQAVFARGTDANELTLLDARLRLAVVPAGPVGALGERRVFVPDTLWTHAQALDPVGDTRVDLPARVFPDADLSYIVAAEFLTADNERHREQLTLPYRRDPGQLRLAFSRDSVRLGYDSLGRAAPHVAFLEISNSQQTSGSGWLWRGPVRLPLRLPLRPLADFYRLTDAAGRTETLYLGADNAELTLRADRTPDSLRLAVDNPRRLPFWYYVYRGDRLRYRGYGTDIQLAIKDAGRAAWHVSLHYRWGESLRTAEYTSGPAARQLTVRAEQPAVAYPGQRLRLTYTVRDEAGRPVPDADLTSWAYTSRFERADLPMLPDFSRPVRGRVSRRRFRLVGFGGSGDADSPNGTGGPSAQRLLGWGRWRQRLGLDSLRFYQFLYPASGQFFEYRPAPGRLTQVAPFVVDSGRVLAPVAFYVDGQPAHLAELNQNDPYTALADSGLHTLSIRTADRRFTLRDVYLRGGHKLTLSLDANQPCQELTVEKLPGGLSGGELDQLRRSVLALDNSSEVGPAVVQQGQVLRRLGYGRYGRYDGSSRTTSYRRQLSGPFRPDSLRLRPPTSSGGLGRGPGGKLGREPGRGFLFEPGYEYRFGPGLLKLTCLDGSLLGIEGRARLANPLPLGDFALTEADLRPQPAPATVGWALLPTFYSTPRGRGRLELRRPLPATSAPVPVPAGYRADHRALAAPLYTLLTRRDDPRFQRLGRGLELLADLPPGRYRVAVLLADSSALLPTEDFLVEANGQTYVQLRATDRTNPADPASRAAGRALARRVARLLLTYNPPVSTAEVPARREIQASQPLFYRPDWRTLSGRLTDAGSGDGLPGVTVLVEGTTVGVSTNADGQYRLQIPPGARALVFSFVGYVSQRVEIGNHSVLSAALMVDVKQLQEVVVTGYGTQQRANLTMSVSSVALEGRTPGVFISSDQLTTRVQIRGSSALTGAAQLLFVVNGLPFDGQLADFDPADIAEIKTLKSAAAMATYGARAAAGVVFITLKKGAARRRQNGQPLGPGEAADAADALPGTDPRLALRRHFADYAWWRPTLTTDAHGRASTLVRLPDDVTSWDTFVVGSDGRGRLGSGTARLRAFKTLRAELAVPRFLVAGDRVRILGKVLNYQPDTVLVASAFQVAGAEARPATRRVAASFIDTLTVVAPAVSAPGAATGFAPRGDSLRLSFGLSQASGYADGEQRLVPVLPAGTLERVGTFATIFASDTTLTLALRPELGAATVRLESDALPALRAEIHHLQDYAYLCNEQAASRLVALLLEARIAAAQGEEFKEQKAINFLIGKLLAGRHPASGLWGTWATSALSPWATLHVLEALLAAERAGYAVNFGREQVRRFLLSELDRAFANQPDGEYAGYSSLFKAPDDRIRLLLLLHRLGAPLDYATYARRCELPPLKAVSATSAVLTTTTATAATSIPVSRRTLARPVGPAPILTLTQTEARRFSLDRYLALVALRQELHLPYHLDSLRRFRLRTELGGVFYDDTLRAGSYYRYLLPGRVGTTLLAYQVLRAQGGHGAELARIRAFLLGLRGGGYWASTYQAAQLLSTIGPDLLAASTPAAMGAAADSVKAAKSATADQRMGRISSQVANQVSGQTSGQTLGQTSGQTSDRRLTKVSAQVRFVGERPAGLLAEPITKFPFEVKLTTGGPLTLRKTGALPVYATAYQTRWNAAPVAVVAPLRVGSSLAGQAGRRVALVAGRPAELLITVNATAEARYVLLEVPIPAGCSYGEPAPTNPLEVHREYLKQQVGIFIDELPIGRHTFRVNLQPRYQGTFTLNPARAELLYFPTKFGRTDSKQVTVIK